MNELKHKISNLFDIFAILPAEPLTVDELKLQKWLDDGKNADMQYMAAFPRHDLNQILIGAKSVIVVGKSYRHNSRVDGRALYACGSDYHKTIKKSLWNLAKDLSTSYPQANFRAVVDTAPALEKAWAIKGGLGFRGRNSLVVNPKLGSYFNIGLLVVDVELPCITSDLNSDITSNVTNGCGDCRACIDACPMGAICEDSTVDARQCISYHTVERARFEKRDIEMCGWSYGCDECQEACKYNFDTK